MWSFDYNENSSDKTKEHALCILRNANMIPEAESWFLEAYNRCESDNERYMLIHFLTESARMKMPYCCETKDEFEELAGGAAFDYTTALHGKIDDYSMMAYRYSPGVDWPHLGKETYWENKLIELAHSGNYLALYYIRRLGAKCPPEFKRFDIKSLLTEASNRGEPEAFLALSRVYFEDISYIENDHDRLTKMYTEQLPYCIKAAKAGLTDGYYEGAKRLWHLERDIINQLPKDRRDDAWCEFEGRIFRIYKKAAELNNGSFAGFCQYKVACYYDPNDGVNETAECKKDKKTAMYWYQRAAENRNYYALTKLNAEQYN